jgi:hypothetical protein
VITNNTNSDHSHKHIDNDDGIDIGSNKHLAQNKPENQDSSISAAINPTVAVEEEIFTYRKHSMDYFTVDGVTLRTGYSNKRDWYLLCLRELLDNAVDFLTKNYKGASDIVIDVTIFKDDKTFRLKIRNSNYKNIPVFQNLDAIFDYVMRYGSKQDVHIINRGMLGDALKQILAFLYILLHVHDDGSTFEDKQPKHPLIIRHNGREFKVYLNVDKVRQTPTVKVVSSKEELKHTDTEIELVLPIIDEIRHDLNKEIIKDFCKKYPLFTTDINFRFHITDNSNYKEEDSGGSNGGDGDDSTTNSISSSPGKSILTAALAESPKAIVNIEYPALHPISNEPWNKQNSVFSYTREEFKRRIVNIDPKQAADIRVYDIFSTTYREGSNLAKDAENEISVAELLSLAEKERNNKIAYFYKQLQNKTLPPPEKLILPYTANKQQRKAALIERLGKLYDDLDSDQNKASYKSIHGYYEDARKGVSYPYFWEIWLFHLHTL